MKWVPRLLQSTACKVSRETRKITEGGDINLYANFHSRSIHKSQKVKKKKKPIAWLINKHNIYLYSEILFKDEKEWTADIVIHTTTRRNLENINWMESVIKDHIFYYFIYTKYAELAVLQIECDGVVASSQGMRWGE